MPLDFLRSKREAWERVATQAIEVGAFIIRIGFWGAPYCN